VLLSRVLGRIFGPKKDEVAGSRRQLKIKELHNFDNPKYSNDYWVSELCLLSGTQNTRKQNVSGTGYISVLR
jgi:hypothetical protein